jgi:hypothetical protein
MPSSGSDESSAASDRGSAFPGGGSYVVGIFLAFDLVAMPSGGQSGRSASGLGAMLLFLGLGFANRFFAEFYGY